jgi:predicted P-loop ATPase
MANKIKTMVKELERMREIRIQQKNIRISLQKREERNKELRGQITPIWADREKDEQVQALSKELFKGRKHVKDYQSKLRQFKLMLRETNRFYDLSISNRIG